MPKYRAVADASEPGIVDALEKIGCTVERIRKPVDLLVGYRAQNFLIECKSPGSYYTGTKEQKDFIKGWRGQVRTVRTPEEAIELVTRAYK